jgi:hypothetical protein
MSRLIRPNRLDLHLQRAHHWATTRRNDVLAARKRYDSVV